MIRNYSGFLLENLKFNLQMLLESNISATSEFMNRLNIISKEGGSTGKIAKDIYNFISDGYYLNEDEIKQNFFDVTDKEGMVSFLMQNKLPKDWNEDADPSLPYKTRGRSDIKVSKIIRYIVELSRLHRDTIISNPTDKDIENFMNIWKSTKDSTDFKFKLVKGDDIARYYNQKRYLSSSGSLGGSCMADEKKSIFKIYSENESKVKLLVLIDEKTDKISGRALVWKLEDSPCDARFFMDRVYTNNDSDFFKFRQHAEENGWMYKSMMNSHIEDNVKFRYQGKELLGVISVKIDGDFKEYPFVDTLCFLSKNKKSITNIPTEDCSILHDVSGESDICHNCNGKIWVCDDGECVSSDGEITCTECSGNGCDECDHDGYTKCDHEHKEICGDCGEGTKLLIEMGIKSEFLTYLSNLVNQSYS